MRVLLADDHAIVRQGLRSLLESKAKVEVIGEASDGREAVSMAKELKPDLVIIDIAMPNLNGLEALLQLKSLDFPLKVIILSMHVEENYVIRALRSGASGYVYKGSAFDDLELAMKAVLKDQTFLSPAVSQVLVNELINLNQEPQTNKQLELLSPREREMLQLMAEKKSRSQIAQILSISVKTVDRHKENLKDKLQIRREGDIEALAKMFGLTDCSACDNNL
jgi:two-component system, NarL family, response regulator NreC